MLRDLRGQKELLNPEETLVRLEESSLKPKFSAGVWFFYPPGGRFHAPYIEKGTIENILDKIAWMHDEDYIDSTFGIEAHFPNEVNRENIELYKNLEKNTGIRLITVIPNLFYDAEYEFGSLSNPDPKIREGAVDRLEESLRLNKEFDTEFAVVWPGIDG